MNKPLVSVIISAYNHAQYIAKMVNSIVKQSYGFSNIELIVIDDCSTDNTLAVLRQLAEEHDFCLIANEDNRGISANLNDALAMVNGKYTCITGSDDFWYPYKLEKQVAFLEEHEDIAVCSGNVIRIDAQGNALPYAKQSRSKAASYKFDQVFLRDYAFVTINAMIRTNILHELGGYDPSLKVEDYYMWLKITNAGHKIHMLSDILGCYRIHQHNTINKSYLIYEELKKILADYSDHPLYEAARRRLDQVYFPQLAQQKKWKALEILPHAVSNTRFFYRGLYHLLNPLPNYIKF